jgi:3-oxoacyl-[acyl-carrier-protein] synthase-3
MEPPPARRRRGCRGLMGVRVLSTGSYVPDGVVTNEHLRHRFGRDPAWIVRYTGISERRHALPHQATSDLCVEAGRQCLGRAGVDPGDVDLLLVATVTPDHGCPATACLVQDRLGLGCPAADLNAACAGFVYALVHAATYLLSGAGELALVIGGECLSRMVDPQDVKTAPLMGDGAGAVLLARGRPDQGLLRFRLGADGSGAGALGRTACGSRLPPTPEALAQGLHYMHMDGHAVFTWAVNILCDSIQEVLRAGDLGTADVDLYVPHQANLRILQAAFGALGVPPEKVFTNLQRYGNTSAASIPLALDEAVAEGRVRPGDRLVLSGFGAGLSWGTAVLCW